MIELLEIVSGVFESGGGWKFVFSRAYRHKTLDRWKRESAIDVIGDIFLGTIGMIFSLACLLLLIALAFGWPSQLLE